MDFFCSSVQLHYAINLFKILLHSYYIYMSYRFNQRIESIARYAKGIPDFDSVQRNAVFAVSGLNDVQRQSIISMAEMASSIRNLTLAQDEQEFGLQGVGLATKLNAQETDTLTASMLLELAATKQITAEQAEQLFITNAQTAANTKQAISWKLVKAFERQHENTVVMSNHEFATVIADSSEYEKRVLLAVVISAKEVLRENFHILSSRRR